MNFKIINDGKQIDCEIILTFRDENNDINYIVYTDGTKDSNGNLEMYASRYTITDGNFVLNDIEKEYEWDLVDNMLESKYKELL